MHDELSEQVELAPDLEWLLLDDQANTEDLLVHLVDDFGAELNLVMQTMFGWSSTAQEALEKSLVRIVLQSPHYRSDQSIKVWLYSLALDTAWQVRRRWNLGGGAGHERQGQDLWSSCMQESSLPGWLGYLPEKTRLAVVMLRYLGLGEAEIAQVLGIPDSSIVSDLAIVDKIFPFRAEGYKLAFDIDQRQRLVQATQYRLAMYQSRRRLRQTILEMSWAAGAILLVALLTRIYDLRNPDPARKAVEIPFLTPLPTSAGSPSFTPTAKPLLDENSTSEEIAVRYLLRAHNFTSLWEDALVILGGAQGSPEGYVIKRVEAAWDLSTGDSLILVGSPNGPPTNGYLSFNGNYYELTIRNGEIDEISPMETSQPNDAYYLGSLLVELQINPLDIGLEYRPLRQERIAGRDALVVAVVNSEGVLENMVWLDEGTAIPLRQQRFGERGQTSSLVLDVIINRIAPNEPFPWDLSGPRNSHVMGFSMPLEGWENDPKVASSLRWMEQNPVDWVKKVQSPLNDLLYYQVKEYVKPDASAYSAAVYSRRGYFGEYPMGNPWTVQCERSPDGLRVAFIEDQPLESGSPVPSQVLHWFSLADPGELHTPLPGRDVTRFAFSPGGSSLAVQASSEILLIDLGSGASETLLDNTPAVDRLLFSNDEKYLGVLHNSVISGGRIYPQELIWIIDLKKQQVVQSLLLGPDQDWETQWAEIAKTYQVDFTGMEYFGLENCR